MSSFCFCRRSIGRNQFKFFNNKSEKNISFSGSTQKNSTSTVSIKSIFTVEDETTNKSVSNQILSRNETGRTLNIDFIFYLNSLLLAMDDNGVEQIFEPRIMYPRNNTIEISSNEIDSHVEQISKPRIMYPSNNAIQKLSDETELRAEQISKPRMMYQTKNTIENPTNGSEPHVEHISGSRIMYPTNNTIQIPSHEIEPHIQANLTSIKPKNEEVYVKNIPSPFEKMMTESQISDIETIDLSSISSASEQWLKVDQYKIASSDIFETKSIDTLENKVTVITILDAFEIPIEKLSKKKIKHKRSSDVLVTIRKPLKRKQ